jgi:transcriptional regulator with XRE-family HTH domain
MEIGERIAAWREAKGLTPQQLAKAIGVTYAAVYQWETNQTTPTLANLNKVFRRLGLTAVEFYGVRPKRRAS